jgi:hypothetical protein
MKITEIELGMMVPGNNYDNIKLSLKASLEDWENPECCADILRNQILSYAYRLKFDIQRYQLPHEQFNEINNELSLWKQKVSDAKGQLYQLKNKFEEIERIKSQIIEFDSKLRTFVSYETGAANSMRDLMKRLADIATSVSMNYPIVLESEDLTVVTTVNENDVEDIFF